MKKYETLYVKYLVKNHILFAIFVSLFIIVFLVGALSIKLELTKSCTGKVYDNRLYIDSSNLDFSDVKKIYLYKNRNENVYHYYSQQVETEKEGVYITLSSLVEQEIEGAINIEIVLGEQTLLERIFLKAGKGV